MMAFRLARVLHLRTLLRERAQEELAGVSEAIAAARAAQDEARSAEAAAAASGVTAGELLGFRHFEGATRASEETLARERARLAEELVGRRTALVARRREERQLELLRERARERAEMREERATMVLLDDLAVRRREQRR